MLKLSVGKDHQVIKQFSSRVLQYGQIEKYVKLELCRIIILKMDKLRIIASSQNPDIIGIVESWVDSSILDFELAILNYTLIRLDRSRHGGGILRITYLIL